MDQKELKQAIGKPHMLRLKQIGTGIKVGKVLGSRVLIKTVTPRTEMDRVEEEGRIVVPGWVKKENTPLPTTGVVILVGPDVKCEVCGEHKREHEFHPDHHHSYSSPFNEGDMVMFPKFAGSDFNIENEDLRICEADEIMCTLVDTKEAITEIEAEDANYCEGWNGDGM